MNANELLKKLKETVKKSNKKTLIASGAVLIIGIAVLLNFLLIPNDKKDDGGVISPAVDLSDVAGALRENQDKGSASTDAFAEMTLNRKQARDEAMEVLKTLAESNTAADSVKKDALGEIEQIAKDIENEANIESLIKSKGFEECVAVINGDKASVLIKTESLLQNQISQISEIVYQQACIQPTQLNIIQSK